MFKELRKIPIILKRDFQLALSYKLAFATSYVNTVIQVLLFIFFIKMLDIQALPTPDTMNPIAYILIGIIGWTYLWNVMSTPSDMIRMEMGMGTLELVLHTPTSIYTLIIAYALWGLLSSTIVAIVYLLVGLAFFSFNIASSYFYAVLIMGISLISMFGLGMIIAGLTMCYKKSGQAVQIIQAIAMFFSNVYFDITAFPPVIRPIAYIFPTYYAITGLKIALLSKDATFSSLAGYFAALSVLCVLLIILGVYVFRKGLHKARKQASLSFY